MRTWKLSTMIACLAVSLMSMSCGNDDEGGEATTNNVNTMNDTSNANDRNDMDGVESDVDMGTNTIDLGDAGDADLAQVPPVCEAFDATFELEFVDADEDGLYYVAETDGAPWDELVIEIVDQPPVTGSYTLGENYETCTQCVLLYRGCDEDDCDRILAPTSGTLEVSAVGGEGDRFTGTLADVEFQEVTIDESTMRATPVADGELMCVESYSFDIFIGNECAEEGDPCELGVAVENSDYKCVEDDLSTDIGTCLVVPANCVYGAAGGGADFCENSVTCDGTEYKIDCSGDDCTCSVDGVESSELTGETCDSDGLRGCGAPIPTPVNPECDENDIYDGRIDDLCEAGVTCNGVTYQLLCRDGETTCSCRVSGGMLDPESTATDCLSPADKLRECGAPIQ